MTVKFFILSLHNLFFFFIFVDKKQIIVFCTYDPFKRVIL